jgi:hypothetical protein
MIKRIKRVLFSAVAARVSLSCMNEHNYPFCFILLAIAIRNEDVSKNNLVFAGCLSFY